MTLKTKPYPLPTIGIDMMSNETALPAGAVRRAENVDIDRNGRFARRDGATRVLPEVGLHSLFHSVQKGISVVAKDDVLYQVNLDTFAMTLLYPLHSAHQLSYTEYNGNLYFTNRTTIGWIPATSDVARAVGVPQPDSPILGAAPGGLLPGQYTVTITYEDERGEEGPTADAQQFNLPNGGGIRLSGLFPRTGWTVNVYLTGADGDQLGRATSFPAVFTSLVVAEPPTGKPPLTQYLSTMAPGELICWHNGRLVTARDGALRFSEPLRPHLHDMAYGVLPVSGQVTMIESVSDGLYVSDNRGVWFFTGEDPTKFEQKVVSSAQAFMRSSAKVPPEYFPEKLVPDKNPVALWLSQDGYLVGMSGGATVRLQADRLKVPSGVTGRSVLLQREGRKQIVTPINSTQTAPAGTAVDSNIT